MQRPAALYEQRFGIVFSRLVLFDADLLRALHAAWEERAVPGAGVTVVSATDPSVLGRIQVLTEVANTATIGSDDRQRYHDTLTEVYKALPETPSRDLRDPSVLYVAPEREGRILAEGLGWLPAGHSLHPHAKRIDYRQGMLVGLSEIICEHSYSRAVVIDGAIASEATLIALMESLLPAVTTFAVYSVHAAPEGIAAIMRYGSLAGIAVRLIVGHSSGMLNRKFYAVDPRRPACVIVGDLGDTIAPAASSCGP